MQKYVLERPTPGVGSEVTVEEVPAASQIGSSYDEAAVVSVPQELILVPMAFEAIVYSETIVQVMVPG